MAFEQFKGNRGVVESLRRMIAGGRLPHSLVLAGPEGVGKYTLATMIARAVNCGDQGARAAGDFCGACANCRAIAQLENYEEGEQFAPVLGERTRLPAEERRDNPLLLSTHPDVFVLPPDGKARQISIYQVRRMSALAQYRPLGANQRVFILDHADRMDEVGAAAMLKTLEEPPPETLIVLTAASYFELLPTIRSRAIALHLAPLAPEEVEATLADLPWPPGEKRLAAHLSAGSPGVARRMDLGESKRLRAELAGLLRDGIEQRSFASLFARTQALAQAREETLEKLLGLLYSLLHDTLYLLESSQEGPPCRPIRNLDLEKELKEIARQADWEWLNRAARRLDRLDRLLRRNINKQVALEALAVSLGRDSSGQ
jgi:DNA polymerase-3 subunit delta'